MYTRDTIAAICTPLGEGGIGIIRVSGSNARHVATSIFRNNRSGGLQSHRFSYGAIVDPASGSRLDEVLLVFMRAPYSYTKEDVLEIHCHGGCLVLQNVLELVLSKGARLAEPGEFTRRAFLNGRIDLVQAEAVIDVIRSKTDSALALAQRQRDGLLSQRIAAAREGLVHLLSLIEAQLDFPEEHIPQATLAEITRLLSSSSEAISLLLSGFSEGRVLREGVTVLIAGKPNVGKSSLLNTLLKEKRVIVTAIPGTTRDIIEEEVNIGGLPVRLLDSAGIRESSDLVEQEGVRMTLERIPSADLVLFLLDGSRPYDREDCLIQKSLEASRVIVLVNKSDLPVIMELPVFPINWTTLTISTLSGDGIDVLRKAICRAFLHGQAVDSREYLALSHARHRDALIKASNSLERFADNLSIDMGSELLAADLRDALSAIGEVTGETAPDEVLDLIFQNFCIGK